MLLFMFFTAVYTKIVNNIDLSKCLQENKTVLLYWLQDNQLMVSAALVIIVHSLCHGIAKSNEVGVHSPKSDNQLQFCRFCSRLTTALLCQIIS